MTNNRDNNIINITDENVHSLKRLAKLCIENPDELQVYQVNGFILRAFENFKYIALQKLNSVMNNHDHFILSESDTSIQTNYVTAAARFLSNYAATSDVHCEYLMASVQERQWQDMIASTISCKSRKALAATLSTLYNIIHNKHINYESRLKTFLTWRSLSCQLILAVADIRLYNVNTNSTNISHEEYTSPSDSTTAPYTDTISTAIIADNMGIEEDPVIEWFHIFTYYLIQQGYIQNWFLLIQSSQPLFHHHRHYTVHPEQDISNSIRGSSSSSSNNKGVDNIPERKSLNIFHLTHEQIILLHSIYDVFQDSYCMNQLNNTMISHMKSYDTKTAPDITTSQSIHMKDNTPLNVESVNAIVPYYPLLLLLLNDYIIHYYMIYLKEYTTLNNTATHGYTAVNDRQDSSISDGDKQLFQLICQIYCIALSNIPGHHSLGQYIRQILSTQSLHISTLSDTSSSTKNTELISIFDTNIMSGNIYSNDDSCNEFINTHSAKTSTINTIGTTGIGTGMDTETSSDNSISNSVSSSLMSYCIDCLRIHHSSSSTAANNKKNDANKVTSVISNTNTTTNSSNSSSCLSTNIESHPTISSTQTISTTTATDTLNKAWKDNTLDLVQISLQLLSHLLYGCPHTQSLIRESSGLLYILSYSATDVYHPIRREWALLCLRNACEGNIENQQYIDAFKLQKVDIVNEQLVNAGLSVDFNTRTGKIKFSNTTSMNTMNVTTANSVDQNKELHS